MAPGFVAPVPGRFLAAGSSPCTSSACSAPPVRASAVERKEQHRRGERRTFVAVSSRAACSWLGSRGQHGPSADAFSGPRYAKRASTRRIAAPVMSMDEPDFDPPAGKPSNDVAVFTPKRQEEYQRPPAPEAHDYVRSILPGEAISHPRYGEGEVIRLRLRGDRAEVEAAFLAEEVGELPHRLMSRYLDDSKEMVAIWFDEHQIYEDERGTAETGDPCWHIDDETGWIYLEDTMWLIPADREAEERDRLHGTTWKRRQVEMLAEPDDDEDFEEEEEEEEGGAGRFPPATRAEAAEAGIIDELTDAEEEDSGEFEVDEDAEAGVLLGLDERDVPVEDMDIEDIDLEK
eukprot:tig00000802_g4305.t1